MSRVGGYHCAFTICVVDARHCRDVLICPPCSLSTRSKRSVAFSGGRTTPRCGAIMITRRNPRRSMTRGPETSKHSRKRRGGRGRNTFGVEQITGLKQQSQVIRSDITLCTHASNRKSSGATLLYVHMRTDTAMHAIFCVFLFNLFFVRFQRNELL